MQTRFIALVLVGLILSSGFLLSCGSGGGDGGSGGGTAATDTMVSGSVQAPNGVVAFNDSPGVIEWLAQLLTPTASASISGLSPVPDGTPVQLARLHATGTSVSFTVLSTTTTSGGRYSFNLTKVGVQFSNDLIVLVTGATGKMLRAFVTNPTVDVDPGSEATVRLVLEQIASTSGATISNFTLVEVNQLCAAVKVLVIVKQLVGGADLDTTVTTVTTAVLAQPNLVAFISAAVTPGQTTMAPGDVGNYFPLAQGNTWNFQGTDTEAGQPTVNFQNTLKINGTTLVGGITATVRSESNPDGSGTPVDDYVTKETTGITNRGNNDPTDHITPQIVPYQEVQFPLQAGATLTMTKVGINSGQDLDGDGKLESVVLASVVTVVDFETVTVAAGSFPNAAQIKSVLTVTVTLSKSGSTITVVKIETMWLAPGVGPIKREDHVTQSPGGTETTSEELVSYVVNG
jgi:hypothetical protein